MRPKNYFFTVFICSFLFQVQATAEGSFRTWTSRKGDTVEAKLTQQTPARVQLENAEGKKLSMLKHHLSKADQNYLTALSSVDEYATAMFGTTLIKKDLIGIVCENDGGIKFEGLGVGVVAWITADSLLASLFQYVSTLPSTAE